MCPVCLAAAALIAVKATSAGGLAALVIKKIHTRSIANEIPTETATKEDQHVQHDDRN